jgi:uncharacterized protein (TIRG00374 family)
MAAKLRYALGTGILASALFLWLALRDANLGEIGRVLGAADYTWLISMVACLVAFYWLKVRRWQGILSHRAQPPAAALVAPTMIGFAVNNLLPARIGELVRAFLAAKQLQLPRSFVVGTIAVERLLDLVAILALLTLGLVVSDSSNETLVRTGYVLAALAAVAFIALGWAAQRPEAAESLVATLLSILPSAVGKRLQLVVRRLIDSLAILRRPRILGMSLFNSLVQWLLMAICIEGSFRAVGLALPFGASLLCMTLVIVSIMLPAVPGFFGAIELAFVVALKPFGVPAEAAFGAAVLFHLTNYFFVTITGMSLLRSQGLSLQAVQADARSGEQGSGEKGTTG